MSRGGGVRKDALTSAYGGASDCRVWSALESQGRMIRWLAQQAQIPRWRLYGLKKGMPAWWRDEEAEAVSRALGLERDALFGPCAPVLPPGRRHPIPRPRAAAQRGAA